jgi:hypothetical protein
LQKPWCKGWKYLKSCFCYQLLEKVHLKEKKIGKKMSIIMTEDCCPEKFVARNERSQTNNTFGQGLP